MAMRILRHEGLSSEESEVLFGIAIEISWAVVHLYTEASGVLGFHHNINLREGLRPRWKDTYTGHRRLKLNKAWT